VTSLGCHTDLLAIRPVVKFSSFLWNAKNGQVLFQMYWETRLNSGWYYRIWRKKLVCATELCYFQWKYTIPMLHSCLTLLQPMEKLTACRGGTWRWLPTINGSWNSLREDRHARQRGCTAALHPTIRLWATWNGKQLRSDSKAMFERRSSFLS